MQLPIVYFNHLSRQGNTIVHFVSTRLGGVSNDSFSSLNLGKYQGDAQYNVDTNRKALASSLGFSPTSMVFAKQVHGCNVARVDSLLPEGQEAGGDSDIPDTDGMVTNVRGICLVTLAADCVSLIFFDPVKKAVGVAHAGWQGTVKRIGSEVIHAMSREYGSLPADILVGIGPSIGPCCYEVGYDVVRAATASFGRAKGVILSSTRFNNPVLNLWYANTITLTEAGVMPQNIEATMTCTKCHQSKFFSARGGDKGRFGAGVMLI